MVLCLVTVHNCQIKTIFIFYDVHEYQNVTQVKSLIQLGHMSTKYVSYAICGIF